jgi:hypothetical protein
MTTATTTPVIAYILWFRESRAGARWARIGTFTTRAAAVARVDRGGDFWLAEVRDERLLAERPAADEAT